MDSQPIDELYFEWLYSQVCEVKRKSRKTTYWNLLRILYKKEFVWLILNDDNRAQDGINLRLDFINDHEIELADPEWLNLGCSVLELLVGLSRRLEFESDFEPRVWFWHFLRVLELDDFNDAGHIPEDAVYDILDRVIWRTYMPNGQGGLFPLKHSRQDQRNVELWYQLNAYLIENDY